MRSVRNAVVSFLPRSPGAVVLALFLLALVACAPQAHEPLRLKIAHVNDTHSALEPVDENLILMVDGGPEKVRARLGGMARLKTALDAARAGEPNVLTLHAGDAVQGTLYFNVFQGAAEFDFLNALGLDAMCLGNHEFDKGPAQLGRMLALARFPVLAANVDASAEPALAGSFRSHVVRRFATATGSEAVAVIGATTPTTPLITSDVGRVRFLDPAPVIRALVRELEAKGVNKIILLSHNGYGADQELARVVPGLDVIVGGHSHSLLGDSAALARLGLAAAGPYPTVVPGPEGAPVLVVQAWRWGEALGELSVEFDAAGRVTGHSAAARLLVGESFRLRGQPVEGQAVDPASARGMALRAAVESDGAARVVAEDPALLAKLAPYAEKVAAFQDAPLGVSIGTDLVRGTATDPGLLVADAYLAMVPGARLALVGAGGIRKDLYAGPVTIGQVLGVLPFGNTLVEMDITGAQLKEALEDAVEFRLATRPPENGDLRKLVVIHSAGFSYVIHPLRPRGGRVDSLTLQRPGTPAAPLDLAATYRLVTNSFLASGGDGLTTLKDISARRMDTGFLEHDALAEHLISLGARGPIAPPAGLRVVIELPGGKASPRAAQGAALGRREALESGRAA
jgi:5'-nucleotidase